MSLLKIIHDLYLTDLAPVSPGADQAVTRFQEELPFSVRSVASGTESNGWIVPNSWCFTRAEIRHGGKVIYDGRKHPLGVVGYSTAFSGSVDLATLQKHLFYSADHPEALVFHATHFFRPLERDWGFVVPKSFYDKLTPGNYDIVLETKETPGALKILDYALPGETDETIVFHAHTCHPGQANDDLSGCAVGIELMKRLSQIGRRRFTYRLILSPELLGSYYWLAGLSSEDRRKLRYGVMLKSVGNSAPLKLQLSYRGNTPLDLAARSALREVQGSFEEGAFRRIYGNDETLFEAPGYAIPTVSLTRYYFPEYHTSLDTPEIVNEENLRKAVSVAMRICSALEQDCRLRRNFEGLLSLSHPRYNLYQPFWNPANKTGPALGSPNEMHYLMVEMFRDFEGQISILEIAERHKLPFTQVYDYLCRLRDTGAVDFIASPATLPARLSEVRLKRAR